MAEGKQLIKKRQKLIKIANISKEGWLVVQEYESDDLASDSETKRSRTTAILPEGLIKFATNIQLFCGKIFYCTSL